YIGRIDHQIKIRGHRIEPGEIVSHLLNHEAIQEAAVVPLQDSQGDTYLCAYYVPVEGIEEGEYTESSLQSYLSTRLPEYMMPSAFCQLEKLPLTVNGKVDKIALPKVNWRNTIKNEYQAPVTLVEKKLVSIWENVLDISPIGVLDNFFEHGGHSLKAMRLVSHIHEEFQVQIPLRDVFQRPILNDMARYIEELEGIKFIPIEKAKEQNYYPTSLTQQHMYEVGQNSIVFNMPMSFLVEGPLNVKRVKKAIKKLIERHDVLRTTLEVVEGNLVQRIHDNVDIQFVYKEEKEQGTKHMQNIMDDFITLFNFDLPPLLRVQLIKISVERHILMFDIHHSILDGTSLSIFTNEFAALYEEKELPPLHVQYKDYIVWKEKLMQTEEMKTKEAYWIQQFSGELPVLKLPYDFPRPKLRRYEGDVIAFEIDKQMTAGLYQLGQEKQVTLYMTLMTCFHMLLHQYSGQEDIVIGSPIQARPHVDLENVLGLFINEIAIRNQPKASKSFLNFLEEVKETVLCAYENQNYPFEELVLKLQADNDKSRSPIFSVSFAMQNMQEASLPVNDLQFQFISTEFMVTEYDISLYASEVEGRVHFEMSYSTHLFRRETMERFVQDYVSIVRQVLANPMSSLGDIKLNLLQL
ncbi:non-ribosomal peptide synthetase, partial [Bacillus pseudomycoides]|uniref:condensation domain-containing protein n=1 Tax=Bacillus pseudomycoides TaxID=64104 RepID=UPI000BED30A9